MVKIVVCNKGLFVCVSILLHVGSTDVSTSLAVSKTDPLSSLPQANVTSTDPYVTYPTANVTSIAVNVTSRDQITVLQTSTVATQSGTGMSQVLN